MTYYDLPLLKPPVWTWEVPAYFFVGGAAGAVAVLGVAARIAGNDEKLVRDARWIAAIGATVSGPLLVADLGRPERFLNMLRVFKPQSPMSVGAWTLALFGASSTAALFLPGKTLRDVAATLSAASGLVMSTYTGVLIGATSIPAWNRHANTLPIHFGASALGSAVALLELRGNRSDALNALGLGAALFESLPGDSDALSHALSGTVPLVLRLFGKRKAAAVSSLLGSLITRYAWVGAGKKKGGA
ncbi:MAG TPA: NrfD/PsrC family molybdoenzyme membrane anchor subunit [Thermoanaerobaculia bacterium]|nr:NrfD/PsrC family molybdoenzyme membrane anchor subunit [Thermoanaerobaculia bacterium]